MMSQDRTRSTRFLCTMHQTASNLFQLTRTVDITTHKSCTYNAWVFGKQMSRTWCYHCSRGSDKILMILQSVCQCSSSGTRCVPFETFSFGLNNIETQDEAHEPECWQVCRYRQKQHLSHFLDTLVGHPYLTHRLGTIALHSRGTVWLDTLMWHFCRTLWLHTLTWRFCRTLLLDSLVGHSYLTLL